LLNSQGFMKSNPDGSNIALALEADDIIELFDFDNSSGIISNPIIIKFPSASYVYGIEFSPNGSILYVSAAGTGEIYQINLQLENTESIQKSLLKVGQSPKKNGLELCKSRMMERYIFQSTKQNFLVLLKNQMNWVQLVIM